MKPALTYMLRLFLAGALLVTWGCAATAPVERIVSETPSPCPDWVYKTPPSRQGLLSFVDVSLHHASERDARDEAARNCMVQFANYCGVEISTYRRYLKDAYSPSSRTLDPLVSFRGSETVSVRAFVSRVKASEWCIQKIEKQDRNGRLLTAWKAYLLAVVPEEEVDRVKQYKTPVRLTAPRLYYHFTDPCPELFWSPLSDAVRKISILGSSDGRTWKTLQSIPGSRVHRAMLCDTGGCDRFRIRIEDGEGNHAASPEVRVSAPTARQGVFYQMSLPPGAQPSPCLAKTAAYFEAALKNRFAHLGIPLQNKNAALAEAVLDFIVYPEPVVGERYRIIIRDRMTDKIFYRGRYLYPLDADCRYGIGRTDEKGMEKVLQERLGRQ